MRNRYFDSDMQRFANKAFRRTMSLMSLKIVLRHLLPKYRIRFGR